MDQRGYPVDPSETTTTNGIPESRLQAWRALGFRIATVDVVPTQDGRAAA